MTPLRPATRFLGARHAVTLIRIPRIKFCLPLERRMYTCANCQKSTLTVNLTPLESTSTKFPVTVANKGLTKTLNPLDATFTNFRGVPFDTACRHSAPLVAGQHAAPPRITPPTQPVLAVVTSQQSPVTIPPPQVTAP